MRKKLTGFGSVKRLTGPIEIMTISGEYHQFSISIGPTDVITFYKKLNRSPANHCELMDYIKYDFLKLPEQIKVADQELLEVAYVLVKIQKKRCSSGRKRN